MKNFNQHIKACFLLLTTLLFSQTSFAHFGSKGPFGGSVSCAAIGDTSVFIGTTSGGVYLSTNSKLVAWSAKPVGLKSGKITALAHTGTYLFAATADSGVFIYNGFVGSDRYWIKVNTGLSSLKITSLVAIDAVTVLAGTKDGGVFKTTNKGDSWTAVNTGLHHLDVASLVKAGSRIIQTSVSGGVYASDDNGANWFDFNDVNTDDVDGSNALSYNSATNEILVLNENGLFVAGSASSTTTPAYAAAGTGLPSGIKVASISNNGTNWYLATDQGVYTSATGTISWTSINTGLASTDVTVAQPFKTSIVAGTRTEGLAKASTTFTSWSSLNNTFNNLVTYSMVTSGDNIVVAATEKGVFVSKDLAASYTRSNKGLTDSLNVNDIIFADFCLLAGTKNAGVFFSADTGKTWSAVNSGIAEVNIKKVFYANGTKYAIAANGNVYSSPLHSSSWTSIQYNLPSGVNPSSIVFYSNKLLLTTRGNGVYVKTADATSWTSVNTGLSNQDVTSGTVQGTKLFVGTYGDGVFVSDSTTISWSAAAATSISHTVTMGLDGRYIQAMAYNAGYVFASYKGGLLATSDYGQTWIAGGNQFNLPSYTDVNKISFVTTRVFVTTGNNGLYSNALSELPAVTTDINDELIAEGQLLIAPNPNSGTFTIGLDNNNETAPVVIYNILGVVVDSFTVTENVSKVSINVTPGVYFVQVATSKGKTVSKLVIE